MQLTGPVNRCCTVDVNPAGPATDPERSASITPSQDEVQRQMPPLSNRLGMASLLCCTLACSFILALMLARQDWVGEYLWIVAPYVAVAIST
jgi:hypothetical protein